MDFEGARGETRLFACFCAQGEKKKLCQQHYGESADQSEGAEHINNEIIHLLMGRCSNVKIMHNRIQQTALDRRPSKTGISVTGVIQ